MLSTGNGVNGFTLDPSLGEFILTHPDIKVSFIFSFSSLFILSIILGSVAKQEKLLLGFFSSLR